MWVEESTGESIVMLWPHLLFATENKESLEGEKEFAADVALPRAWSTWSGEHVEQSGFTFEIVQSLEVGDLFSFSHAPAVVT